MIVLSKVRVIETDNVVNDYTQELYDCFEVSWTLSHELKNGGFKPVKVARKTTFNGHKVQQIFVKRLQWSATQARYFLLILHERGF